MTPVDLDITNTTYTGAKRADFSGVYIVKKIRNSFSNGKFIQTLDMIASGVDKTAPASAPSSGPPKLTPTPNGTRSAGSPGRSLKSPAGGATSASGVSEATINPNRDTASLPATGDVISEFGPRTLFGRQPALHNGIDITGQQGEPISSVKDGTVVFAGQVQGYGNLIEIKHADGTITQYAHLSSINVSRGDSVTEGSTIGGMGGTRGTPGAGNSEGPHLHFGTIVPSDSPLAKSPGAIPVGAGAGSSDGRSGVFVNPRLIYNYK
jgi:murein DD-endopeptidase MepM/ murein hydrolase activator NlpD